MTVKDTSAMIVGMTPLLTDGLWVYCFESDPAKASTHVNDAFAVIRETAGVTLILTNDAAAALGYDCSLQFRLITLNVFSDLEGVGLTAAVAQALTDADISCNIVTAYHHEHVFVPNADADRAVDALVAAERAAQ